MGAKKRCTKILYSPKRCTKILYKKKLYKNFVQPDGLYKIFVQKKVLYTFHWPVHPNPVQKKSLYNFCTKKKAYPHLGFWTSFFTSFIFSTSFSFPLTIQCHPKLIQIIIAYFASQERKNKSLGNRKQNPVRKNALKDMLSTCFSDFPPFKILKVVQ